MAAPASRPQPLPTTLATRLAGSLLLALMGQAALGNTTLSPMVGTALYLAAAGVFAFAVRHIETDDAPWALGEGPRVLHPARGGLWFTAFALSLITVLGVLAPEKPAWFGRMLIVLWLNSIVLFGGTVLYTSGWAARLNVSGWWQTHWRDVAVLALLGVAAAAVRLYDLELHPYSFINDEGEVGREAQRILNGEYSNWFDVAWAGQPIWSFVPAAIGVKLFGNTAFAIRWVSAMQGTLTVMLTYLLGKEIANRLTGGVAAALLLTLPFHVHFSRLGVSNVSDAFTSSLILWLTLRAARRGTPSAYWLAGLATGLALYTYLGSRLAMMLAVALIGYTAVRHWRAFWPHHVGPALVFAGAALVVAAPMAAYFYRHPDLFYARLNTEGIVQNGFLQRQAEATGKGVVGVLVDQFRESALVYVARPALAGFFNSPQPYLTPIAAVFFAFGLAYAAWRVLDPRYGLLLVWFWSVVILGSAFTIGPPTSQRLLMSAPPLVLLVAIGLLKTVRLAIESRWLPRRLSWALGGLVVIISMAYGLWFYFGPYRGEHYFEIPGNEMSYEIKAYSAPLGADYRMYLLGEPRVYAVFASFDYFAPDMEKWDFNAITAESVAALPRDKGALFVASPEREADLKNIAQWAPGGEWIATARRYQPPEVLYYAYIVSPEKFGARP